MENRSLGGAREKRALVMRIPARGLSTRDGTEAGIYYLIIVNGYTWNGMIYT